MEYDYEDLRKYKENQLREIITQIDEKKIIFLHEYREICEFLRDKLDNTDYLHIKDRLEIIFNITLRTQSLHRKLGELKK